MNERTEQQTILSMRNVSKHFGVTQALKDVSFDVHSGEVHALMGENGAGKSTLVKILAAALHKDRGTILYKGRELSARNPQQSRAAGINVVYQEVSLVPLLTVGENIYAASVPMNQYRLMKTRNIGTEALRLLDEYGIDLRTYVKDLAIAGQQVVEIAGALSRQCDLLILDEPTASLTNTEAENLFSIIRRLKSNGVTVVYISHKIDELFSIADHATVLKDGEYVGTVAMKDTTKGQLVSMMVGRDIKEMYPPKNGKESTVVLDVDMLSGRGFREVSFQLYAGEILGFAGLAGSGRTELFTSIFGTRPVSAGAVKIEGRQLSTRSAREAIDSGLGYLPEDRKQIGLFYDMTIQENIVAASLDELGGKFLLDRNKMDSSTYAMREKMRIKLRSIYDKVSSLSGGNQQKVLLARWLLVRPKILIVDEPTRGIDVGAKHEVYQLLRSIARSGVGVIMISSEMPEILGMSDRVVVMYKGRVSALLSGEQCTTHAVGSAIMGL